MIHQCSSIPPLRKLLENRRAEFQEWGCNWGRRDHCKIWVLAARTNKSRGGAWVQWLCPYNFLHITAVSIRCLPFYRRVGLGVLKLRTLLPFMCTLVVIPIPFEESSWPSVVVKCRGFGLVRESRTCERCPSSFSWFDGFIFAFQTSFRTSIALGTLFVAFLLLRSISKDGALYLHSRIPFLCWERTELAFVYQGQGMMLTSVYILSSHPWSAGSQQKIDKCLPALDLLFGGFGAAVLV